MPDARFYASCGALPLSRAAEIVGAELVGDQAARHVTGVAPLRRAGPDAVSFFSDARYLVELQTTRAAGVLVSALHAHEAPASSFKLICADPLLGYAKLALHMHPARVHENATPAIHPDCRIASGVRLGPGVVVGQGAQIGEDTQVGGNTVVGPGTTIGRRCRIGPNVTLGFALVGDDVCILAGAVVGEAGFGVAGGGDTLVDVPQLGRVILQDGVSVGANACIDRGAWDDTYVGESTKIDNMVQVAHNVQLGRNCVLAAHTGISGSVVVGDHARFGGRAGVIDHLRIGDRTQVAAASAVTRNVPDGEVWGGAPARPLRRWMQEIAWVSRQVAARRT